VRRFDQINVIPFIDIMLVLLAIVLTTASFIAQGKIPLDLPEAASAAPLQTGEALEIAVNKAGLIHLDGELIHRHALDERLAALAPDTAIVLRVDAAAEFRAFVAVVDRLKAHELNRVTIVTRQPS
jgi:biopolymer transport protein ExbD